MFTRRAALAGLASTILPLPGLAHHGFGGRYERGRPIWAIGTVEAAYFGQPHAEITLRPDTAARKGALANAVAEFQEGLSRLLSDAPLEIEFPPVRLFFSLDGRVTVGDRVEVITLRNCIPPHQLRAQAIRLSSGEWIVRAGRMQTETETC